ncbi:MAG TPA: PSD1 and planctomycete cytochrome C domain-containing protein [Gemmataceae bacterium]|nr:PSD1 and planctomycete cytochrome C domain-containing protein [Gemmataceae bacterium]
MTRRSLLPVMAFLGHVMLSVAQAQAETSATVDFNRDIRPIFSRNCFPCHGQDAAHRATKMRLDRRESAVRKQKDGNTPIVPGSPQQSELYRRIMATNEDERMPPRESGHHLTPAQIETLRCWIGQGAPYAEHWAFVKPQRPPLPAVKDRSWPRHGIDYFILDRLERAGLRPSEEADRFMLLRRASLDLRGLPPTPQEVDAFARDTSPNAYGKAVDRFLKDPAYGERWARMWLDLARYADSAGYGSDPLRTIWRYRDWVIDAFNRNLPYDHFTIEQIAGDLLRNATLEQRMATAFHRNTMTNTEGGTDREEFRVAAVKDRIDTTLQVWMGLTLGCAKCHSHKYDPITQKEYYQFYAFFNQTADADRPDEEPTLPAPTPDLDRKNKEIDARLATLKRQLQVPTPQIIAAMVTQRSVIPPAKALALVAEIKRLNKTRATVPTLPVMVELPAKQQRETHLMVKGNFLSPGEKVDPAVPAAFHSFPPGTPVNRLGVARWLVDPNNPLTARVAVNRYWAQIFGTGLVETEEDFGTQGELPSHAELLDWLATEYVRLGWDTRAILKLIVTSATYRQSSKVTPELLARDPRNRLLSRGPRFRLEAEMVRDQALALSGLLSHKIGGPSVYPPQPPGLWQAAFNGQRTWATSSGEDRYRRGLYTFWRRTIPYPSMTTFDAPSREICTLRRIRTNTPLQAFVTLNDPVYVEIAQALARRIVKEGGAHPEERARYGLQLCLCRPPRIEQVKDLIALYQAAKEHYRGDAKSAVALATEPLGPLPAGMPADEMAAWTVVANVLLNLDGVMTKG